MISPRRVFLSIKARDTYADEYTTDADCHPGNFFRAMPSHPTTAVQSFGRRCCAFTRHYSLSITHLAIDPVDLPILILELAAHVDRHVP